MAEKNSLFFAWMSFVLSSSSCSASFLDVTDTPSPSKAQSHFIAEAPQTKEFSLKKPTSQNAIKKHRSEFNLAVLLTHLYRDQYDEKKCIVHLLNFNKMQPEEESAFKQKLALILAQPSSHDRRQDLESLVSEENKGKWEKSLKLYTLRHALTEEQCLLTLKNFFTESTDPDVLNSALIELLAFNPISYLYPWDLVQIWEKIYESGSLDNNPIALENAKNMWKTIAQWKPFTATTRLHALNYLFKHGTPSERELALSYWSKPDIVSRQSLSRTFLQPSEGSASHFYPFSDGMSICQEILSCPSAPIRARLLSSEQFLLSLLASPQGLYELFYHEIVHPLQYILEAYSDEKTIPQQNIDEISNALHAAQLLLFIDQDFPSEFYNDLIRRTMKKIILLSSASLQERLDATTLLALAEQQSQHAQSNALNIFASLKQEHPQSMEMILRAEHLLAFKKKISNFGSLKIKEVLEAATQMLVREPDQLFLALTFYRQYRQNFTGNTQSLVLYALQLSNEIPLILDSEEEKRLDYIRHTLNIEGFSAAAISLKF